MNTKQNSLLDPLHHVQIRTAWHVTDMYRPLFQQSIAKHGSSAAIAVDSAPNRDVRRSNSKGKIDET